MPNVVIYVISKNWVDLPSKNTPIMAADLTHIETGIKNVTDFVNTIDATSGLYLCGAPFTQELLTKLNGIEAQANKYVLPKATTSVLGGVKVDGVTITVANGVISAPASGVTELSNLTDINLSDLSNGQILKYNSTTHKWENATGSGAVSNINDLGDVNINSAAEGQALVYSSTAGKWVNSGVWPDATETLAVLNGS